MSLFQQALEVRERAYAPYSKFKVGAAIRSASGKIFIGCNVENVAYPEGACAEAGAIAAMVAGGETSIEEICIVADSPVPVSPVAGADKRLPSSPNRIHPFYWLDWMARLHIKQLANYYRILSLNLTCPKNEYRCYPF